MWKRSDYELANAEDEHRRHPRSFFIPSREERESIAVGEAARLLFRLRRPSADQPGAERMWVEVTGRTKGGGYAGLLMNQPVAITSIAKGDAIAFGPEHVIMLLDDWPLLAKKVCVSRRSHERDQRPRYISRTDPLRDDDSGWQALVGDETDAEVGNSANVLLQPLGYLIDRWPELRAVFRTDPVNGDWTWDDAKACYLPLSEDSGSLPDRERDA